MEVSEDDVPAFEAFAKAKFPDVKFKFSQITDESDKVVGYHYSTTITPGKNDFGWWCGEHVVEQTAEVIVIFEFLHSRKGTRALLVYDNSTNHSCLSPGALRVGGVSTKGKVE
jgi:hypothetical protein